MRPWFPALALFVSLAPAAFAGGLHARIEGPDKDGITYTARTLSCDPSAALEPWALAEGVVDGKRKSVLIQLEPTEERGVYRFTRTWPMRISSTAYACSPYATISGGRRKVLRSS